MHENSIVFHREHTIRSERLRTTENLNRGEVEVNTEANVYGQRGVQTQKERNILII